MLKRLPKVRVIIDITSKEDVLMFFITEIDCLLYKTLLYIYGQWFCLDNLEAKMGGSGDNWKKLHNNRDDDIHSDHNNSINLMPD